MKPATKPIIRFMEKVLFIPFHSCWEWGASKNRDGYGKFHNGIRHVSAHRFIYEETHGPIGDIKKLVCHKCDNRGCVNPKHLFLGSHKDNTMDAIIKKRWKPAKGEGSGRSRLKNKEVIRIRKMYPQLTQLELAIKFGVSKSTIQGVVSNRYWKHL